jgi:hypothetical protein
VSPQPKVYFIHEYSTDIVIPIWALLLAIGLLGLTVMRYRILSRRKPPIRKR